jgi:hypothetical protein
MRKALLLAVTAIALPAMATTHTHKPTTAALHKATAPKPAGMSTDRATEIQTALIRQGYLTGAPTGAWDADSVAAMQKLQADNGWQTKFVPDSRALIKLGIAGEPTTTASTIAP